MQDHINVSGVLCSSYDTFFEAEKKIADYILEHKSEIIDMTVAELALASGTSDATVSRFCRRCGFNGFHHLKITLAKEVAEERGNSVEVSNDMMRSYKLKKLKLDNQTKLTYLQMKIKVSAMKLDRMKVELRNEQYLDSLGSDVYKRQVLHRCSVPARPAGIVSSPSIRTRHAVFP